MMDGDVARDGAALFSFAKEFAQKGLKQGVQLSVQIQKYIVH